ncbi:rifin PIR protein, putative [Plasmodium reichenowi]|uniref:Rifin PIR protein, putative n=1 Tax=Plasmodium reichenowi TaxID=5854 RepID=A0A2P9DKQ9_PLARE|nr:rifin PIR protein, putative [Plasmodium reichenowi]
MKVHYINILLFVIPLNILVTSYHEHNNNNEPHSTSHNTPIYTSRVLIECDTQLSIDDKDADMKSVMQQFDDRTSQCFEEYEERMKEKRQKRKEERDKNIQKIIHKDKMEKNLAEKVEKGCLRCGCGLGGVAASVGIFGTVAVKELAKSAIATAVAAAQEAVKDGAMAATIKAAGAEAFKSAVIEGIKTEFGVSIQDVQRFQSLFTTNTYPNASQIANAINTEYRTDLCLLPVSGSASDKSICPWVMTKEGAARVIQGNQFSTQESIKVAVKPIVSQAETVAERAVKTATAEAIKASTDAVESTYAGCQTAIIASVVAIIIIALVMIIIYLVLRYRRKKKMKKKSEYTKLLNQ